jgi:hypothetical protein
VYHAGILEFLGTHAHVAWAVAPFLAAMALRLLLGKTRFISLLVSLSAMWFAINVLMTPYSPERQREIESLWALFR